MVCTGDQTTEADSGQAGHLGRDTFIEAESQRPGRGCFKIEEAT